MKPNLTRTYIAIGSNLENPIFQVQSALAKLRTLTCSDFFQHSSFCITPPLPPVIQQPDFVNAVAAFDTDLSPDNLLHTLQTIEIEQGRERIEKWGPRTLDLDLLLYGNEQHTSSHLKIPHPGITQRNFVLYPLAEICFDLVLPNGTKIKDLLPLFPRPTILAYE